jgi:hypothetical protein
MKAVAFSNNSTVFVAWLHDSVIPDCLGFSIRRIDVATGKKDVLPSWVPFEGQENTEWKAHTTDEWPVQKFNWKDFTAPKGGTYKYEIVPMTGTPGALTARQDLAVITNDVRLCTDYGDISAAFTKGILSTQAVAHALPTDATGAPDFEALLAAIKTPGNPLREKLNGGVAKMLMAPILKAKAEGGRVYSALYELADPELVDCLVNNWDVLSLILANTGKDDETNKPAREKLHEVGADITDRMVDSRGIGHNKSTVRVDANDVPQDVTTGSTNWTPTGLCTQSNNVLTVRSPELAKIYLEYWKILRQAGNDMSPELRAANATRKPEVVLPDGTRITVWFAPNTTLEMKPKKDAPVPPDMAEVFQLMDDAKQQVLFLAFYPGFPSVISKVGEMNQTRNDLFIRGAVSSPQALPRDATQLFHGSTAQPVVVTAAALDDDFAAWHKELLKAGPDAHAIIHDKIIVIDPLSEKDCVVILGSHNLGFKASYQNDENMLIIRGNRALAIAYMVHVLDVYDHYRFRYLRATRKSKFSGFLSTNDKWQGKYLNGPARKELEYMTGASGLTKVA